MHARDAPPGLERVRALDDLLVGDRELPEAVQVALLLLLPPLRQGGAPLAVGHHQEGLLGRGAGHPNLEVQVKLLNFVEESTVRSCKMGGTCNTAKFDAWEEGDFCSILMNVAAKNSAKIA